MLERDIEAYLVDRVKAIGGLALKFTSPARRNVPDRIVIAPVGKIFFVELKAPGKKMTDAQLRESKRLAALGCDVFCINSKLAVDAFIREVLA